MNQFTEDVSDTLRRQLQNVQARTQLQPAADLAAQQLEILKPIAMIPTAGGIAGGPVASVQNGVILIVLADQKRVVTTYLKPSETGLLPAVEECVAGVLAEEGSWRTQDTFHAINFFIQEYGGAPGAKAPDADIQALCYLLGILFASIPIQGRHEIVTAIETSISGGVCPVLVGLIGPGINGKPNTNSGAWPLMFGLAPYADTIAEG